MASEMIRRVKVIKFVKRESRVIEEMTDFYNEQGGEYCSQAKLKLDGKIEMLEKIVEEFGITNDELK